jgi:hypothetical protein
MVRDTGTELIEELPTPAELNERLSRALREVDLCRRLMRVAERAEQFREADRRHAEEGGSRE